MRAARPLPDIQDSATESTNDEVPVSASSGEAERTEGKSENGGKMDTEGSPQAGSDAIGEKAQVGEDETAAGSDNEGEGSAVAENDEYAPKWYNFFSYDASPGFMFLAALGVTIVTGIAVVVGNAIKRSKQARRENEARTFAQLQQLPYSEFLKLKELPMPEIARVMHVSVSKAQEMISKVEQQHRRQGGEQMPPALQTMLASMVAQSPGGPSPEMLQQLPPEILQQLVMGPPPPAAGPGRPTQ